tara:strand:+ start:551 stop:718 length:168 start_codon:yes stop_codon:yes gene_type:complete
MSSNKIYNIATEINGTIVPIKGIPKSSYEVANDYAKRLRELSPRSPIMLINTEAE